MRGVRRRAVGVPAAGLTDAAARAGGEQFSVSLTRTLLGTAEGCLGVRVAGDRASRQQGRAKEVVVLTCVFCVFPLFRFCLSSPWLYRYRFSLAPPVGLGLAVFGWSVRCAVVGGSTFQVE